MHFALPIPQFVWQLPELRVLGYVPAPMKLKAVGLNR